MDLKNRIRVALGLDEETKLAVQEKLVDGTIIVSEAEALEVGADVSVLAEDGTTILLAPGDYELENGTTFVVAEEGIIAEIEVAEETEEVEEETTEEEVVEEELSAEDEVVSEQEVNEVLEPTPKKIKETKEYEFSKEEVIKELTDVVSELLTEAKNDIEAIRAELSEMRGYTETLETQNKELSDDLTKLSKEPAADDINLNKFSTNEVKELTKRELSKLSVKERVRYNLENLKK